MFRKLISPNNDIDFKIFEVGESSNIYKKMELVKQKLNTQKGRLDNVNLVTIKNVMKSLDKYYSLHKILKRKFNAQVVTNAWLKCYELINEFNLLEVHAEKEETAMIDRTIFLNAELPGSFICAINHYFHTNQNLDGLTYTWMANSLINYNIEGTEEIAQDNPSGLSDAYGIFVNNLDNWTMGQDCYNKDHNGDVTDINVIDNIENHVLSTHPNGIFLYTSDIGLDVSHAYQEQEELNSLAHLGQILLGLKILGLNGNMLIKQYTYFTDYTLSLLIMLTMVFEYVYISKPLASKPTNSEIYIVCKKYKGTPSIIFTLLTESLIKHKNNGTLPHTDGSFINLQHPSLINIINNLYYIEMKLFKMQYNTLDAALNAINDEQNGTKWKRTLSLNNDHQGYSKHIYEHNRWLFFNNIAIIKSAAHIPTNHKNNIFYRNNSYIA